MAVMNLQNDGKQVLRFCSQFVQEWVASVSAGAGVKHDLFWISSELTWLHCFGLCRRFISTAGKPAKVALQ